VSRAQVGGRERRRANVAGRADAGAPQARVVLGAAAGQARPAAVAPCSLASMDRGGGEAVDEPDRRPSGLAPLGTPPPSAGAVPGINSSTSGILPSVLNVQQHLCC
jgi:hypothetical protein